MHSRFFLGTALGLSMMAVQAFGQDAQTYIVTTNADSGAGSLRAALDAASAANTSARILVAVEGDIAIASSLTYSGTQPLDIAGNSNLIHTDLNVTLLSVPNGADLVVTNLAFRGPGGFSVENRGDLDGPAGKGIAIAVPTDRTGDVTLALTNVRVSDVAGHGVHLSDCSIADDCGNGSAAGLDITLTNVVIENVGHGRFDADGFRADERGAGSIMFRATGSDFKSAGADGVELDEGDHGDVSALISNASFIDNGNYCDPAVFGRFLPAKVEDEFKNDEMAQDAIPGPVTNAPDNRCIEREVVLYRSGFVAEYAFGIDLDDGIDLDEAGAGSIVTSMLNVIISGNRDEGVDWDEDGPGDINATFVKTEAFDNIDDGYKMSEAGTGSIFGMVDMASAVTNGGKGFVFEEENSGNVVVTVTRTRTSQNDDGDDTGLEVVQDDSGTGLLTVTDSQIADGIDAAGVIVN
ncbi:hypothetical protein MWU60_02845 [Yoonia sp. F2084L]|uniref:hypothetical protein n=1 Tax=Yoonia sp. F2084L TaxID=2926419 RepID=UPI001FF5F59E|nr:hypothetical protein [Yoonia sp. F2084L]MCK0094497.1 hypothetical protein [Yoonia sp. F2084L]